MSTRPTRIAQTSKEAQKKYKKHGPRLPELQQRQLERALELDNRAARAREQEERRRIAKKKREEKERKERDARKQMGVGLATQVCGYSHTQKRLKSGMEAFLGLKKRKEEDKKQDLEFRKKLKAIAEEVEKEPWDDSDGDDVVAEFPVLNAIIEGDQWIDDDLDDDTLFDALIVSDKVEQIQEPLPAPPPPPPPVLIPRAQRITVDNEEMEFVRLHGPINKAIEERLGSLPEPLIELLSLDTSSNLPTWNPAPSLLHKLNPVGLPPHRLRLKVGCVITVLRDLNTSSQLSKSSHLRVLRVEKDWLECLVLDGQLEGTKSVLTRVPFTAKYRNEDQFSFQRTQFPIKVSLKSDYSQQVRDVSQSTFKIPSISGQPPRQPSSFKKPAMPASKTKPNAKVNPSFKLPGLPASKAAKPSFPLQATLADFPVLLDGWDDFLDSGTQIARELSSSDSITRDKSESHSNALVPLSTQDLDFTMDDLEDSPPLIAELPKPFEQAESVERPKLEKIVTPHRVPSKSPSKPKSPRKLPWLSDKILAKSTIAPPPRPPVQPALKRKSSFKPSISVPPPKRPVIHPVTAPQLQRSIVHPVMAPKRSVLKVAMVPAPVSTLKPFGSFSEFGLSTQEAVSFFDDDDEDLAFGSPPIAV